MTRYKIQYRDKTYTYTADDAEGAISKFCDRPVFGSPLAFSHRVLMIDADTRGREWCRAELNFGGREPRFAIIDAVRGGLPIMTLYSVADLLSPAETREGA